MIKHPTAWPSKLYKLKDGLKPASERDESNDNATTDQETTAMEATKTGHQTILDGYKVKGH